ncbi:hypothetical protein Y032_0991g3322 [Ancylostoma ceylanicum]|uniref:Uncharacterized protein n=1 Tax=Ancylostoma ceylanicum TaxID=53326 RepID=A0A016W7Z1_9BILA|nr:hypothetical protein Y032_0991g3322 [Ancylostoma ceylanicum]
MHPIARMWQLAAVRSGSILRLYFDALIAASEEGDPAETLANKAVNNLVFCYNTNYTKKRAIAPRFAVAGDCEAGTHRLWAGIRWRWRPSVADIGDRSSPMLATVATAPIDCGISQSVANVGDPPSPTLATGGRGRQRLSTLSWFSEEKFRLAFTCSHLDHLQGSL